MYSSMGILSTNPRDSIRNLDVEFQVARSLFWVGLCLEIVYSISDGKP